MAKVRVGLVLMITLHDEVIGFVGFEGSDGKISTILSSGEGSQSLIDLVGKLPAPLQEPATQGAKSAQQKLTRDYDNAPLLIRTIQVPLAQCPKEKNVVPISFVTLMAAGTKRTDERIAVLKNAFPPKPLPKKSN